MRTDRLQREHAIELRWSVFPLHPEIPEEGISTAELFAGRGYDLAAMQARLLQIAAAEGVPMAERSEISNSRRAQELGKWAESQGAGDPYRRAVYRAYFAEGRNIGKVGELVRVAESVGLDGGEAGKVLETGRFGSAVEDDWRRAGALGIDAVPTHLCAGRKLTGFADYAAFVRLIGAES